MAKIFIFKKYLLTPDQVKKNLVPTEACEKKSSLTWSDLQLKNKSQVQIEGIPQGNVVSPTCSILKINKIVAQLPIENIFQMLLYKYDLQISYCHPNWNVP